MDLVLAPDERGGLQGQGGVCGVRLGLGTSGWGKSADGPPDIPGVTVAGSLEKLSAFWSAQRKKIGQTGRHLPRGTARIRLQLFDRINPTRSLLRQSGLGQAALVSKTI
ncbi:MAG TPA: hypothetical protein PL105_10820 [Caldilineaceae bacterium]|nr:hypothetical protein [Caldilineaceae bacterium]